MSLIDVAIAVILLAFGTGVWLLVLWGGYALVRGLRERRALDKWIAAGMTQREAEKLAAISLARKGKR